MAHSPAVEIVHLADRPEAVPVLERLFVDAWEPWYGPDGDGDAAADLAACISPDALPLCLVALDASAAVVGTAMLKDHSVGSDIAPGPWLAALLVDPACRGQGIATELVEAVEGHARRLGFDAVYTSTDTAQRLVVRRGWTPVGTSRSLRGAVDVFECRLRREERMETP